MCLILLFDCAIAVMFHLPCINVMIYVSFAIPFHSSKKGSIVMVRERCAETPTECVYIARFQSIILCSYIRNILSRGANCPDDMPAPPISSTIYRLHL